MTTPNTVKINCGGTPFETTLSTLKKSDYFNAMIERWNWNPDQIMFLDDDPKYFRIILLYLRDNVVEKSDVDKDILMTKFEYYLANQINDSLIKSIFKIKSFLDEEQFNYGKDIYCYRFTDSMIKTYDKAFSENYKIDGEDVPDILQNLIDNKQQKKLFYNFDYSKKLFRKLHDSLKIPTLAFTDRLCIFRFTDSFVMIYTNQYSCIFNQNCLDVGSNSTYHDKSFISKKKYYYEFKIMNNLMQSSIFNE
jgi:hypothetical protein